MPWWRHLVSDCEVCLICLVWQPIALKPVVPVLRDRCFECVYVYIVIVISKCVYHLHNKELLYFLVYRVILIV